MKNLHTFKKFSEILNEEKREVISLTYNTDPDDLKYVKNLLAASGIEAIVASGTFDDEVEIVIKPNLKQKAIKALRGDGFDI